MCKRNLAISQTRTKWNGESMNLQKQNGTKWEKEISKSFDDILDNQYKDEVLNLIKVDIRKNIKNISEEELKHYCNNIYDFACLKAHNVNDNEVINLLMEYNNDYVTKVTKEFKESNIDLNFNTNIAKKYINIIKEKIS